MNMYPGVVTKKELHSLENLRGIPLLHNRKIHLSRIRIEWNKFYDTHKTSATKDELLKKATEIDDMFGHLFTPPVRPPRP